MKEIILEFLNNFWLLLTSIAIFILIGVIIAGILKQFLPDSFIRKHLGKHSFITNIKAVLLGIPLPLCSCSVVPFITTLKQSGASRGAIQTFLISTPITGADSILATYAVFGWVFTLFRLLSSVIISLVAGFLSLLFLPEPESELKATDIKNKYNNRSIPVTIEKPTSADIFTKIEAIFRCSFDEIFKDFARPLLIGILLGAAIVTFMPENLSTLISKNSFLNYILILLVAAPLYVCATASIPLGLSLLVAGFSPGAVFIFLTAGPATNTMTMAVVNKTLGRSSLFIYLFSVIIGSLFFGFLFDMIFAQSLGNLFIQSLEKEALGFIEQVSAVLLLYLVLKYSFSKNSKISSGCAGSCGCD